MSIQTVFAILAMIFLSLAARWVSSPVRRQVLLLTASYVFYFQWAGGAFLLLLVLSTVANYACGMALRRRPTASVLGIGVGFNVLLLGSFKYLLPLARGWDTSGYLTYIDRLVLPLGISFWTFQALSYLIDIYLEKENDASPLEFSLYMAFWPTVVSGPICRLPAMLPQFRQLTTRALDDIAAGLPRIAQGLFMKIVLAELLNSGLSKGAGVTGGFDRSPYGLSAIDVCALAIGFGLQLYFDFAGYSHMAIGAARLMGIRVPENFARPYSSTTPSIFWTRWHMSLSFWIRDYVFVPLSTLRRSAWWHYAALIVSMAIFGFWHGPKFTYIIWGAYHGVILVGHRVLQRQTRGFTPRLQKANAALGWLVTMVLVFFGYLWFRANNLQQASEMVRILFSWGSYRLSAVALPHDYYVVLGFALCIYTVSAGISLLMDLWPRYRDRALKSPELSHSPSLQALVWVGNEVAAQRWWLLAPPILFLVLISALMFFGRSNSIAPFIYTLF